MDNVEDVEEVFLFPEVEEWTEEKLQEVLERIRRRDEARERERMKVSQLSRYGYGKDE